MISASAKPRVAPAEDETGRGWLSVSAGLFCAKRDYRRKRLRPISLRAGKGPEQGTNAVKLLLAIATLAGSVTMLVSDWAGQAFPYL